MAHTNTTSAGMGLQIFHEDGSPNLLSLYSGDLGERLLSYASASELCKLDALDKQFRGLTPTSWGKIANERFGMKNGKGGWRMGTSLLRKPVYIHINTAPDFESMYYAGSPCVTTHNSLVAVTSDDWDEEGAPIGIGLYNSQDLSYLGPRGELGGWKVGMAGPPGEELFITNYMNRLYFGRGAGRDYVQDFPSNRNSDGIPAIGCETHVIIVTGNTLNLYKLTSVDDAAIALCQSVLLGRGCRNNEDHFKNAIVWGGNQTSEFVVYHSLETTSDTLPATCELSAWSLDAEVDRLSQTLTIQPGVKLADVAMAEDFIVGSSNNKKIHVWDRHTSEKKPFILCDVEEEDQLEENECIHPLRMSCHGHMLVTASHLGCALCVWNLKTGKLLKKYNDAVEARRVDMLPDGFDVTSMAYLKHLNGFICASGYLDVWTFPMSQSQKEMALTIRRREAHS